MPTTAPEEIASHTATFSENGMSPDETPKKLAAQQVRWIPDASEMRDAIVSAGRVSVPLAQTAVAAAAGEAVGLHNIFARLGSWLKHTLSALQTLFF